MGGRGTFASGKNVPFTYETIGTINGIKVLKGIQGKHGLPEESHSSSAYISLHPDGSVKKLRIYNSDKTSRVDIENSIHQGKKVLHAHDYKNGKRQPARPLTKDEKKKYKKFFGG
ncbi:MAG: hypothetical protein J6Z79_01050 [Clostridia bacterium]|nr:hypothetical protein [Clostridia bacterium]